MDTLKIRPARRGDLEALASLYREVDQKHVDARPDLFQAAAGPFRPKKHIDELLDHDGSGILVARSRGILTGFLEWYLREAPDFPILRPRRWIVVDTLAVRAEYRRQGIGQALMAAAEEIARTLDAATVELKVYEFNDEAVAFYERMGFTPQARWYAKSCYTSGHPKEGEDNESTQR